MSQSCYLIRKPKVVVAYTHVPNLKESYAYACHFRDTELLFPGGESYSDVIVCNGGQPSKSMKGLFPDCGFIPRSNVGWDIGGYQEVARTVNCDLLLCFGQSAYFNRAGWLKRIVEAWQAHGPGMYGFFSSCKPRPCLLTSAFACPPSLLSQYPAVATKEERYEFEHGFRSLWVLAHTNGLPAKLVTWDGDYDMTEWRKPANILWRGDQSNCLLRCNHTDKYFAANPKTKLAWGREADGL